MIMERRKDWWSFKYIRPRIDDKDGMGRQINASDKLFYS